LAISPVKIEIPVRDDFLRGIKSAALQSSNRAEAVFQNLMVKIRSVQLVFQRFSIVRFEEQIHALYSEEQHMSV
jgi:hypothetical protein